MSKMNKAKKVTGLFLVAALALSGGCGNQNGPCPDVNQNGICDDEEDGDGGSSSSGVHSSSYRSKATKSGSSGISSGTKGGIGSSGQVSSG